MLKPFRFLRGLWHLDRRLTAEEQQQASEGYSIRREYAGPETYTNYLEGEREANILVQFNLWNDVIIFTDSFRRWAEPYGEPISDLEFAKILSRSIRYFECWGGEVTTNDMTLETNEDIKAELEEARIPYEELPGGVIKYSNDIDEERKRPGGIFRSVSKVLNCVNILAMNIGRYKDQIVEVCREFDVLTLSVFGSVARGEDGPKSDVDLLVKFKRPVGLTRLIRLEDRFAQIFGRRVDLGTENSLHPLLRNSVLRDSKVIYEG